MSTASSNLVSRRMNPLLVPMVAVSSLAVIEAVVVMILLAVLVLRSPSPVVEGRPVEAASGGSGTAGGAAKPVAAELPHGKVGQRVESGGFAITVEKIVYKAPSDPLEQVNSEQRYLALLVAVENQTGGNISFYDTAFCLQDNQNFEYKPLAMKLIAPSLQWRNMGNREKMRGYVDFIVPRSSKGLTLIYTHLARPIHIELGE